ncbi:MULTISPECIES: hypothetical protein [unclassified Nocardia]|uniref:hypothetical protein n=1 Tax=Nocardia sp. NPDC019255 TaxID=3154591 RepID=UPI0033F837D9
MTSSEFPAVDSPHHYALLIREGIPPDEPKVVYVHVRRLEDADVLRYREAYNTLDGILNVNVFTYVKETFKGFMNAVQADVQELQESKYSPANPDGIIAVGVRMRTAVLSMCSALYFHQEHNYKQIVRKFGENGSEHNKVQKIFNRLFERSPEYRLLYHLRNTMVHYALDVVRISAGARLVDEVPVGWTDPKVDISAMIELNTELKEAYRRQLRAMAEDPSILELVSKAMPLVFEANEKILRVIHPEVDEACQAASEFDAIFADQEGVRALGYCDGSSQWNKCPKYTPWASNVVEYAIKNAPSRG